MPRADLRHLASLRRSLVPGAATRSEPRPRKPLVLTGRRWPDSGHLPCPASFPHRFFRLPSLDRLPSHPCRRASTPLPLFSYDQLPGPSSISPAPDPGTVTNTPTALCLHLHPHPISLTTTFSSLPTSTPPYISLTPPLFLPTHLPTNFVAPLEGGLCKLVGASPSVAAVGSPGLDFRADLETGSARQSKRRENQPPQRHRRAAERDP